jgi:hypothetical protein
MVSPVFGNADGAAPWKSSKDVFLAFPRLAAQRFCGYIFTAAQEKQKAIAG